jgi:hypothetical protein
MPWNALGKMLFPRLPRWERRRKVKMMMGVLLAGLVFAACVGVVIYKHNIPHR